MTVIDLPSICLPPVVDLPPVVVVPALTRCELVWDQPNISATLSQLLRGDRQRLGFEALARFVSSRADLGAQAGATLFFNVTNAKNLESFVFSLRSMGFGIFALPKVGESDIDDNLVAHVRELSSTLGRLLIATHDRALIQRCLAEVRPECQVTVVALEEHSSWAMQQPRVQFLDLEDIPGLFPRPLARMSLGRLPAHGALLPPLGPLRRNAPAQALAS